MAVLDFGSTPTRCREVLGAARTAGRAPATVQNIARQGRRITRVWTPCSGTPCDFTLWCPQATGPNGSPTTWADATISPLSVRGAAGQVVSSRQRTISAVSWLERDMNSPPGSMAAEASDFWPPSAIPRMRAASRWNLAWRPLTVA